jgi:hypothetical protein
MRGLSRPVCMVDDRAPGYCGSACMVPRYPDFVVSGQLLFDMPARTCELYSTATPIIMGWPCCCCHCIPGIP